MGTVAVRLEAETAGIRFTRSASFWKKAAVCSPE